MGASEKTNLTAKRGEPLLSDPLASVRICYGMKSSISRLLAAKAGLHARA